MRWLSWSGSVMFLLIGLALLVLGGHVALSTDRRPTHVLGEADIERLRAARHFVESHRATSGAVPDEAVFAAWARAAPESLRLDGVGFSYSRPESERFDFSWWGGNVWLTWRSESPSEDVAEIAPGDYFCFGSKWLDLMVFFVSGVLAIVVASVLSWAAIREQGDNLL